MLRHGIDDVLIYKTPPCFSPSALASFHLSRVGQCVFHCSFVEPKWIETIIELTSKGRRTDLEVKPKLHRSRVDVNSKSYRSGIEWPQEPSPPSPDVRSEHFPATAPKRKILNEKSQAKDPNRKFPSENPQTKVTNRQIPSAS